MNIIMAILLVAFGARVFQVSGRKDKTGRRMGLLSIYMGIISALSPFDFGYAATAIAAIVMILCQVSFVLITVYYLGRSTKSKAKPKTEKKEKTLRALFVA